MAHITLSGTLLDPATELAVGDQVRFTHKSTTGDTVEGSVHTLIIPPNGAYSVDIQYGLVMVEYKDARRTQFANRGIATVNQDNPATSIPELLNALVPVSSEELIEFQAILADCVAAADRAEAAAATIDGIVKERTLSEAIADGSAKEGDVVIISDQGNGIFEYVPGLEVDGENIFDSSGVVGLQLIRRYYGSENVQLEDGRILTEFVEETTADIDGLKSRVSVNESDISALQAGQGAGTVGFATQALLYADLNYDDKTVAYVTNDTTVTNNGTYRKDGASGAGSWVQSSEDLANQAYQKATQNEQDIDAITELMNLNAGLLDDITDRESPFLIDSFEFFKAFSKSQSGEEVTALTKLNDNQFSLSDADALKLFEKAEDSIAISGGDYDNKIYTIIDSSSGAGITTVTVAETLPVSIVAAQPTGQGGNGQHLSRLGQKAYAEFVADEMTKYNYKKDSTLLDLNFTIHKSIAFNTPSLVDLNGEDIQEIEKLGSSTGGGFVEGTTNLAKSLSVGSDKNIITTGKRIHLSSALVIKQGVSGDGVSIKFRALNQEGFLRIPITGYADSYTATGGGTFETSGVGVVEIFFDGVSVLTKTIEAKKNDLIIFDFRLVDEIEVRIYAQDSVPTSFSVDAIQAFTKRYNQAVSRIINSGDVVAVLADSWGQFPSLEVGETGLTRPDGSVMGGLGWMSEHMRDYLADKGIVISAPNMSLGGQTSEWGAYWIDSIINLVPKPTHCILHFSINDNNSSGNYPDTPSVYDFDPNDQWENLPSDMGGVFGSTNNKRWLDNTMAQSSKLLANGIKPIILMPPLTSSSGQAQTIKKNQYSAIYSGLNNKYFNAGGNVT